jgi:hypothetical protein
MSRPNTIPPTLTADRKTLIGHSYSVELIFEDQEAEYRRFTVRTSIGAHDVESNPHKDGGRIIQCHRCDSYICAHVAAADTMSLLLDRSLSSPTKSGTTA